MSASRAHRVGGRLVIAATLSSLLTVFGGGTSGETYAAARPDGSKNASSWKTVRTEEFSGSSLPAGCGAYSGRYEGGASAWSSKDVDVSGGLLKLKLEKRVTSGQPYSSGGVGCWGWAQKYGRFEVKAKVPRGKGIDSYFTLWPSKGGESAWTGMELLAPGPETAYVTNGYGTRSEGARVKGKYSGDFHTYVIEWAPKHVRITVDGGEIYYSTKSYPGTRWLGMVVSNGDALTGLPDSRTDLPAQFQIDRIKISAYTGVAPKARPRSRLASGARITSSPTPSTAAGSPMSGKVPATAATTAASSLQRVSAQAAGPELAGGVWPWLLGGSLIAACAVVSLNHPRNRRPRQGGAKRRGR